MNVIVFKATLINTRSDGVDRDYTFLYLGETFSNGIKEFVFEIGNGLKIFNDTFDNNEDGSARYLAVDESSNYYNIYATWIDEHQMI